MPLQSAVAVTVPSAAATTTTIIATMDRAKNATAARKSVISLVIVLKPPVLVLAVGVTVDTRITPAGNLGTCGRV